MAQRARTAVLVSSLLPFWLPLGMVRPTAASMAASPLQQVQVVAHGVKLSLSMRGGTYPPDALVRVTVRLENVSHHPVRVGMTPIDDYVGWMDLKFGPGASVIGPQGTVYPPVFAVHFEFHGGKKFTPQAYPRLSPHHMVVSHTFVILRAPVVRGVAAVVRIIGKKAHGYGLQTPPVRVALVPGTTRPPPITFFPSPEMQASIPGDAPSANRGLFSFQFWICGINHMVSSTGGTAWVLAQNYESGTYRFTPDCSSGQPIYWGLAAGFLNEPVASMERCTEPGICSSGQGAVESSVHRH